MRRKLIVAAVVTALVAISISGCAAGAPESTARELSPIEQYMSVGQGTEFDREAMKAQGDAQLLAQEELVAACMKEQGFVYVPFPPTPLGFDFSLVGSSEVDSPEWIERYGYGIVNAPDREDVVISADPNVEIVESLSESDKKAYTVTLWGGPDAYTADGEYDPTLGGCFGAATVELAAQDPLTDKRFAPLQDAVLDFYTRLMTEPEVVELDTRWAQCMDAAGHGPYVSQLDALAEINGEYVVTVNEQGGAATQDPALRELADRELILARADLECREEVDYRAQYAPVRNALEERFVEENLADLEAFKTAAEQSRVD